MYDHLYISCPHTGGGFETPDIGDSEILGGIGFFNQFRCGQSFVPGGSKHLDSPGGGQGANTPILRHSKLLVIHSGVP